MLKNLHIILTILIIIIVSYLTLQVFDLSNRTVELAKVNYELALDIEVLNNSMVIQQKATMEILKNLTNS